MGQTYSHDFRAAIRKKFLFGDVSLDGDEDAWRVLFTSTLTPQDVAAQLSWNDIRLMRRSKPQNLAALLYRCMQQLVAFTDRATATGAVVAARTVEGPTSAHAIDPTAAVTALRIIGQVLPCIFEPNVNYVAPVELLRRAGAVTKVDDVVDPDMDPATIAKITAQRQEAADVHPVRQTTTEDARVLQLPQSAYATDFWQHFFVRNSRCRVGLTGATETFSPVMRANATAGPRCLGAELMAILTNIAFVPGFTLSPGVRVDDVRAALIGSASPQNLFVWPLLLDGTGISHTAPAGSQRVHSAVLGYEVLVHRELVFSAIVAALSLRVMIGQSVQVTGPRDVFFESFVDRRLNPMLPTLMAGCWNYVVSFSARGALPYTSHYAAETPELLLATTEQLLAIALTPLPLTAEASTAPVSESAIVQSQFGTGTRHGHFEFLMELFVVEGGHGVFQPGPASASAIAFALLRACGSPLYAAFKTLLPGSQRHMTHGVNEALLLLALLITSPLRSLVARPVIEALLRACTVGGTATIAVDDNQIPLVYTLCHYVVGAREDPSSVPLAALAFDVLHGLLAARPLLGPGLANEFVQTLSLPLPLIGGKVPVSGFDWVVEATAKGKDKATVGDFCLVAAIDLLTENAPRWTLPLVGPASTVVKALMPQLEAVSEFAQFELFHAVEFIVGRLVGGPKRSSVNQELAICNLLSAVVQFMALRPLAAAPFVASIATVKLSMELERLAAAGAGAAPDQMLFTSPAAHDELAGLTALFSQAEAVGREALGAAAPQAPPYEVLAKHIPYIKTGVAGRVSLPQVTLEAQQWNASQVWATVLRSRSTPLLDLEFARLF